MTTDQAEAVILLHNSELEHALPQTDLVSITLLAVMLMLFVLAVYFGSRMERRW